MNINISDLIFIIDKNNRMVGIYNGKKLALFDYICGKYKVQNYNGLVYNRKSYFIPKVISNFLKNNLDIK